MKPDLIAGIEQHFGSAQSGAAQLAGSQWGAIHPGWFIVIATVFALVPMVMGLFTAYLKVSVVLGMVRSALGTQHTPSGLVVMAMSVAITGYAMAPVFDECAKALPAGDIRALSMEQAGQVAVEVFAPLRRFLERHAGEREIHALKELGAASDQPLEGEGTSTPAEVLSLRVLLPAFVLTEIKEAFAMGFVLLLPFLVVDLIVANLLVGMGMTMVSPIMVALPLKILLLVVSDGWLLITRGLVQSYQ